MNRLSTQHLGDTGRGRIPLALFAVVLAAVLVGPSSSRTMAQAPAETINPSVSGGTSTSPIPTPIPSNFIAMMEALGWFVIPFLIATVIAVWFTIERMVVLRSSRVIPRPFVQRFLQHLGQGNLDPDTALKLCEENGSPMSEIFAHGIRKWGKSSVEVEQSIIDGGEREVSHLRKHLSVLNGVATVAPLLGLLGTVLGMIQAFNDIAGSNAMGKPEELARGIAIALLTTAVGLTIAIPSLIMYMFLVGRVDALVMEMDRLAQNVVQFISAEALAVRPAAKSHAGAARVANPPAESRKAV